jgi:hypothetical protein
MVPAPFAVTCSLGNGLQYLRGHAKLPTDGSDYWSGETMVKVG